MLQNYTFSLKGSLSPHWPLPQVIMVSGSLRGKNPRKCLQTLTNTKEWGARAPPSLPSPHMKRGACFLSQSVSPLTSFGEPTYSSVAQSWKSILISFIPANKSAFPITMVTPLLRWSWQTIIRLLVCILWSVLTHTQIHMYLHGTP